MEEYDDYEYGTYYEYDYYGNDEYDEYEPANYEFVNTYMASSLSYLRFLGFSSIFLASMYCIACILGLIGNALVLVILIFYKKKALNDIFLISLATADFCFLCTLPFWTYSVVREWIFHSTVCKIARGLHLLNLYGSMLTLTCMTVDRFFVIVLPTKAYTHQVKREAYGTAVCILVWIISLGFALPQFIYSKEIWFYQKVYISLYPTAQAQRYIEVIQLIFGFLCPLFIMLVLYPIIARTVLRSKGFGKHKSLQIILAIVVTFVVTQTPYNMVKFSLIIDKRVLFNPFFGYATIITEAIAYFHSCLNPVLYYLISMKFRKHFMKRTRPRVRAKEIVQ